MRRDKAWGLALGVLTAAVAAVFLYHDGPSVSWFPRCLFHRMTGLLCPGCGMTRAAHAVLHGRLGEAFHYNPLGMVVLPAVLGFIVMRIPAWLRSGPQQVWFKIGPRGGWWIVGVVLGYWIVRNIPLWPFTMLAPP